MPQDPDGDALHLAIASFYGLDVLLTWNCTHLANPNKFGHIATVNNEHGGSSNRSERSGESYNSVGWQGKTGNSAAAPPDVHGDDVLPARYEHTRRADGTRAGVVETDAHNLQGRMSLVDMDSDGNGMTDTRSKYDYADDGTRVREPAPAAPDECLLMVARDGGTQPTTELRPPLFGTGPHSDMYMSQVVRGVGLNA